MPRGTEAAALDETDRLIVNALQGGFPLVDEPYREVAESLSLTEDELLARLKRMLESRVLTRFGPMYQIERMGGAFALAAMQVPEDDFERVTMIVNSLPDVAHNYRREHAFNMWFVLATETPEGIGRAVRGIETATGYPVFPFSKEREYFVEMRLHA
ncbi:MAG: AsnC family transcriptional regulator [Candidatus Nitricoxidivorans perseverans]|uniref:siroheme decarboxylase n=1 Tax=Candidatus Nitricoxidivorans perseverans TaxID=2975601 RepID=A0AA49IZI0_9PROT|nr:MAG: AsnC family transcriptional regulator [Candidatus Nitricoxidivorans perseverans]